MTDARNEMAELLFEIADGINAGLGHPSCNEPCDHGGRCTLDTDHDGLHQAGGTGGKVLCEWGTPPEDNPESQRKLERMLHLQHQADHEWEKDHGGHQ